MEEVDAAMREAWVEAVEAEQAEVEEEGEAFFEG